jgi:hypothetical protein
MFLQVTQITRERLQRLAARADALLALTDRLPIRGGPGIRVETGPHGAVISALATAARPQVAMPGGGSGSDVRVVRITGKYSTAAGGKYLAEVYPMSSTSDDAWTDTTDVIPGDMLGTPTQDAIFMNVIEYGIGGSDYLAWDDVTDTDNIYGVGVVVGTISGGTYDGYLKIAGIAFKPNVCTE